MLDLNVKSKSPAAITAAFKRIQQMVMTDAVPRNIPIHITLEAGIYREVVRYNLANPLVMESAPGVRAEDCIIQADNCEAFRKGLVARSVFAIGINATNVTLRNFSIINTHNKSITEGSTLRDSAEAFVWNNTAGSLFAEGMRFEGRQHTLFVKGNSWFLNCSVGGDVDFVYGEPNMVLFEGCRLHLREDNRGDFDGYAVSSRVQSGRKGFIFLESRFTGEPRQEGQLYLYRTEGKGSAASGKDCDSMALINCMVDDVYNEQLVWDNDMELNVFPRGNAKAGIREYNTRTVAQDGSVTEADTSRRNIKSYTLTDDDYFANYASRYLILQDSPFAQNLD